MVEYSLAKAEVEGSSPFFRLGLFPPSFLPQKSIFFSCLRYREGIANKSRGPLRCLANGNHLSWFRAQVQPHAAVAISLRNAIKPVLCPHYSHNKWWGWKRPGGWRNKTVRRVIGGAVLSLFLAKANLRKKFFFFIAPREKLRSVALLEFSLESNSYLWIMQLFYYAELIKILFIYQTYNLQT